MKSLFPDEDALAPLTQRILLHFKRYRASFLAAIVRAVLPAEHWKDRSRVEEVTGAIEYLLEHGFIKRLRGESYFSKEVLYLSGHSVKTTDVALTFKCFMGGQREYLLNYEEVKPLFSAEGLPIPFHNFRHTLNPGGEGEPPSLSRVYQCRAKNKTVREQIRRHLTENSKGFSHWLDVGSYQLSVCVTSKERLADIERIISETYRASPPLKEIAGINVSIVPTEETFEQMIKEVS